MGYIYSIRNKGGEVIYIGQTVYDLSRRTGSYLNELACNSQRPVIQYLRRKSSRLKLYIEEQCADTDLNEREAFYIKYYASLRPLLNVEENPYFDYVNDIMKDRRGDFLDIFDADVNYEIRSIYQCMIAS